MPLRPSCSKFAAVMLLLCARANAAGPLPCGGLPRLEVKTAAGFCVGLVAEQLKAPRGVLPLPNGDLLVADMGGWEPRRGRIWRLRPEAGTYAKTVLFDRLDRPNSLALGPDGKIYVGMPGRVARFDASAAEPALSDVIGGTSRTEALPLQGRHLLPAILFDSTGKLLVSVGSASDHCEGSDGATPPGACAERTGRHALGVIRSYTMVWPGGTVQHWKVLARGLRNSMAMAVEPRTGTLWQGENARDSIHAAMPGLINDNELPHDELNAIVSGGDYGWPYCYDMGTPSPEYPTAPCGNYLAPARLLPAHAAPLGMTFYNATQFPSLYRESLLVAYHGYRRHGHRVVALLDEGKGVSAGRSVTLVHGDRRRAKGLGAPVGIAVGLDGGVYMSDDHAGIVAKLYYEGRAGISRR